MSEVVSAYDHTFYRLVEYLADAVVVSAGVSFSIPTVSIFLRGARSVALFYRDSVATREKVFYDREV